MASTSIIIPSHNAERTLGLQLESIYLQEEAQPFEVIIVCNNCSDDTRSVAVSWSDRLDIKIIEANDFVGASYARNVGVRMSQGEKLLFCDADDVLSPHFVVNGQRALNEVEIFCGGFQAVANSEFVSVAQALSHIKEWEYETPSIENIDFSWPVLAGGSFGITRRLMIQLGGFDPAFEPGAEDNEFGFRALQAGYPAGFLGAASIAYRMPQRQRRAAKLITTRAKSTALLINEKQRWDNNPVTLGKNPLLMLIRTVLAGASNLAMKHEIKEGWDERFYTHTGICWGWIEYRVLRQRVASKRGTGLFD